MPIIPIDDDTKLFYYAKMPLPNGNLEALAWEMLKENEVVAEKKVYVTVFFPTLRPMIMESTEPWDPKSKTEIKEHIKKISVILNAAAKSTGMPSKTAEIVEEEDLNIHGTMDILMWLGQHPNIMAKISDSR
jgi:hypothetical protein